MKVTNMTIVNMMNVLGSYSDKKLPQKISFAITKNSLIINKEYQAYEIELKKIFNDYSSYMILDEHGNKIFNKKGVPIVSDDKFDEYYEKITELLDCELDVDFYLIDLDCFDYDDKNGVYDSLSPNEMVVLQSIICKGDS